MTNKHTSQNQTIIRFPSITDPYVYLKTLADSSPLQPLKYNAYLRASGMLDIMNKNLNSRKVITGSLNFLKQIAQQERANEIAFFRAQMEKLKPFNGSYVEELSRDLETFSSNPSASNYIIFIKKLNEVLQGVEKTEKRIQSFLNNYDEKYGKTRKDLNTIALKQADTLLNSLREQRTTVEENLDELIRMFILKFMERKGTETVKSFLLKKGSIAIQNFVAASVYLQQSIYKFLVDNPEILNYTKHKKINLNEAMEKLYPQFEEAFLKTNEASIFQQGGPQLDNILNEISNFFEIEINAKEKVKRGKKQSEITDSLNNLLSLSDKSTKYLKDLLRRTKIKSDFNNTQFGNFKELDSLISGIFVKGALVGAKGGGTDSIYIGDFEISSEISKRDLEILNEKEIKLLNDLKKNLKPGETTQNTELFKEIIIKLNNLYNTTKDIKQGFIIHESTKYYKTLETGEWYRNTPGFKGREMNIFNYIDDIATLGADFGINTDWLKFGALNLSRPALGTHLVAPLEKYFTTFIGLIMFDDFELIAKNFTQTLPNSKISVIHLYKLQDLYFPTSYFLEQTYKRMSEISDSLQSGNGFHITIKLPASDAINREVKESFPQHWENVKQVALQETKIQTSFALNFLDLMSKLFA